MDMNKLSEEYLVQYLKDNNKAVSAAIAEPQPKANNIPTRPA